MSGAAHLHAGKGAHRRTPGKSAQAARPLWRVVVLLASGTASLGVLAGAGMVHLGAGAASERSDSTARLAASGVLARPGTGRSPGGTGPSPAASSPAASSPAAASPDAASTATAALGPPVLTAAELRACPPTAVACVDLATHMTWLQSDGKVTFGPVWMEPGPPGTANATPRGTFQVSWKAGANYVSTEYGEAMPYATFFAPGGVAFHGGSLTKASHGCVHLTVADARYYNDHLPIGAEVAVF